MNLRRVFESASLVSCLFTAVAFHAQNPSACLLYGPSLVQIKGTLVRKTLPGPPNYESIEKGDKGEHVWLLVLAEPVCVEEDSKNPDLNPAQRDIREIQLVLGGSTDKIQQELLGKKVIASGTLFGAHTGHHRTPVLLTVKTLAKAN